MAGGAHKETPGHKTAVGLSSSGGSCRVVDGSSRLNQFDIAQVVMPSFVNTQVPCTCYTESWLPTPCYMKIDLVHSWHIHEEPSVSNNFPPPPYRVQITWWIVKIEAGADHVKPCMHTEWTCSGSMAFEKELCPWNIIWDLICISTLAHCVNHMSHPNHNKGIYWYIYAYINRNPMMNNTSQW